MALYSFGGQTRTPTPYFDPFSAAGWWNMNDVQRNYYQNNPDAVRGYFNAQARQLPGASRAWTDFSTKWMGDIEQEYKGIMAQTGNEEMEFWDYARQQQGRLNNDYKLQQAATRPPVRQTRWLRRN